MKFNEELKFLIVRFQLSPAITDVVSFPFSDLCMSDKIYFSDLVKREEALLEFGKLNVIGCLIDIYFLSSIETDLEAFIEVYGF